MLGLSIRALRNKIKLYSAQGIERATEHGCNRQRNVDAGTTSANDRGQ